VILPGSYIGQTRETKKKREEKESRQRHTANGQGRRQEGKEAKPKSAGVTKSGKGHPEQGIEENMVTTTQKVLHNLGGERNQNGQDR